MQRMLEESAESHRRESREQWLNDQEDYTEYLTELLDKQEQTEVEYPDSSS